MSAPGDVEQLLQHAPERFRSVRIGVSSFVDWGTARRALERYPTNPVTIAIPRIGWPSDPRLDTVWRAWYERPCRSRIERFNPPDRLQDICGGTEHIGWAYSPISRTGYASPSMGCVPDQSGWVDFKSFTSEHPPAEMLNPSALFIQSEGSREDIRLEVIGRGEHLGRQTSRVSAVVPDWDSRVTWMEILQVADDYELVVDQATGIILRAACRLDGEEFAVTEIFDLSFDLPIDPELFEYRPPPRTAKTPGAL